MPIDVGDVTGALAAEARGVFSRRSWWLLFPLMALLTLVAFPMNDLAAYMFGNFDPQGDDQVLEQLGVLAAQRYTSGHSVGQFIATLFGASLVTNEYRRRTAAPLALAPWRTALVAKIAVAVLTSLALAAIAVTATFALVQRHPIATAGLEAEILANPDRYPYALAPEEIHAGVRRAALVGLVGFPLWALVGVGLGAVVRRQVVAVPLGVVLYLITFFVYLTAPTAAGEVRLRALMAVPTFTHAAAVDVLSGSASGSPFAAVNPAATAALAVLLCAAATIMVARRDVR